ncbi:hypothetical protein N7510_006196 [Penicillium lagena]|uniref:uncharacterized protein n=1 Tax=Penicillium lagena TaxID=94218 RepID=UPI00253F6532|nr:uncharacterized protein N7510_006196 [Penicillium lagena]KAJ5613002.1 hypothetical protein N7510_006196 [Penicillium lagena]
MAAAMIPQQSSERPPETACHQFRTPSRPASHSGAISTTSKSTTSKRARSPASSVLSRTHKRNLLSNPRAQPTLTQIDFVTQPEPDYDQLAYVNEPISRHDTQNTAASTVDDGSDDDLDYRPPPARPARSANEQSVKRRPSSGINSRDARRNGVRKSATPRASVKSRGGRKSMEKPGAKRDKTLTQMDFVRRYITIDDDDDDVNMGYLEPFPQRNVNQGAQSPPPVEAQTERCGPGQVSPERNRRVHDVEVDLSTGEPISESGGTHDRGVSDVHNDKPASAGPVTPQKSRRLEIPSSQSPESPGLAIITSSQFRSATRSPLKQKTLNPIQQPPEPIKEESPEPQFLQDEESDSLARNLTFDFPKVSSSLPPQLPTSLKVHSTAPSTPRDDERRIEHPKSERTVVYETDAETDYGDFENDEDSLKIEAEIPSEPNEPSKDDATTQTSSTPQQDDSQEYPLPTMLPNTDHDFGSTVEPSSDASVCYQRLHPATQFPHEPIPALNTQKLSELFSHEGSARYLRAGPPRSSPEHLPGPLPPYQIQTQTQTQSQDPGKTSTEIVPESSPIRGQENDPDLHEHPFQRPPAPDPVVQVESSQAVDRGSSRPGVLSRSQLLTSSVMESVPLPNFWMGSQDSVGEPYSLPEG